MTVELNVVGVKCNLSCTYCYENPMRAAGNFSRGRLNVQKSIESLKKFNSRFTLFGGEPLLARLEDLEELWKFGFDCYGGSGIQSNGALITDEHLELFKKYNVHVGISIDGPGELNAPRCSVTETDKTVLAISKLLDGERKGSVSLIITLHRHNGRGERLEKLKDWLLELDRKGLQTSRIHLLEPNDSSDIELSEEETIQALTELDYLEREELKTLKFDLFSEMRNALSQKGSTSCIWNGCDPYNTQAVQGIEADGTESNCGRINKDGVNWVKTPGNSNERLIALWNGDCHGCRFFIACKGNCPGTAEQNDWRRKTVHCGVLYNLFSRFEDENSVLATDESVEQLLSGNCNTSSIHGDGHTNYGHGDSHTNVGTLHFVAEVVNK